MIARLKLYRDSSYDIGTGVLTERIMEGFTSTNICKGFFSIFSKEEVLTKAFDFFLYVEVAKYSPDLED